MECQEEVKKIEREVKRRENLSEEVGRTPDKYSSWDSIKKKKDSYKKKLRLEKIKSQRLEKRVESLLVKLDSALSDDLTSILSANQHKMTELQKLFWQQQRKAFSLTDPRGMRWHPMMVRIALHFHSLSDSAYEFVKNIKILCLPSKRLLYDYSNFVDPKEGCQEEFLNEIKEKINCCGEEDHFTFINLMFDEMHIKAGLVVKRSTGELIGYTRLDDCEEELRKMQHELASKTYKPALAKKVLVYMAHGVTSSVKDIVAIYSTDDLAAGQLYERTWDVIYHLENAGIKVLAVTCDGASINRKFINMHESLDKADKYVYCTKNLASGDSRPLFFVVDPPHLLKTLRNALANSFSHKRSRKLWKNNQFLSWKVIELLFELTSGDKFRHHKLTKAHIKLTSFSCMTVSLATQVMSNSVANCIQALLHHEKMQLLDTDELVKFIRIVNRFFDCVNGKEDIGHGDKSPEKDCEDDTEESGDVQQSNPDKASYTSSNDSRFGFLQNEFLGYFNEWMADIDARAGIFSDSEKNQMIVSHQALGALQITVNGIVGAIKFMLEETGATSVCARVFNQDPLEQYFSKVRRSRGDSNNPTLKVVHDVRLNLHAQGRVSVAAQKGNTQVLKRKVTEVDDAPLPKRVAQRKPKD
ncbi:hypothetical protein ONE63_000658 [Megalurothrips usitatus]|uniref:Transposable element P transposase n=1 Tax=Megalurothrips usitatus TaxID=439358 RepID=A0AAV7Y1N7_9NEOP|nr:hypothetical protein ONE63_000658 [Megalurothrips usitatus]